MAAKIVGCPRTIPEVARAVQVCDETIIKRVEEFKLCPTAKLTREQFKNPKYYTNLIPKEPPSFK